MKKLSLIILILLTLLLTACRSPAQNGDVLEEVLHRGELRVGMSPDFAPYEFIDTSKGHTLEYVGADVELAKYIAESLGVKLVIMPSDFDSIPFGVSVGRYDIGISGFSYTPERAEFVDFSNTYGNETSLCQGLLIRRADAEKYQSLADFSNQEIAVQNGSVQFNYVSEQLHEAQIKMVGKVDDGLLDLQHHKVAALAVSCDVGQTLAQADSQFLLSDVYFDSSAETGTATVVAKDQTAFLNKINVILKEVSEKGLYSKWMQEAQVLAETLGVE